MSTHPSLASEPRAELPRPIPPRIAKLPLDARGYFVPFFVAWIGEPPQPDFRVVDQARYVECVRYKRCWLCGEPLGKYLAYVLGPMCVVTGTTSEPGSHVECAEWAVRACPHLINPHAKRREANRPAGAIDPPGIFLTRNPGAVAVYVVDTPARLWRIANGTLLRLGPPLRVSWWAQGRSATRAEVLASIESGLPALRAVDNDAEANRAIDAQVAATERLLPPPEAA